MTRTDQNPASHAALTRIFLRGLFIFCAIALHSTSTFAFFNDSSTSIKHEITELENTLKTLPTTIPTQAPWTLGYSSRRMASNNVNEIISIEFQEVAPVDQVVLMPAAYTDDGIRLKPFGFPRRFYIERVFTNGNTEIIADFRDTHYAIRGIEPQIFPCPDAKPIQGLNIIITRPSENETWWKGRYFFAMAEVFAFADEWNAALNANFDVPSARWTGNVWTPKALVDGFSLFSPVDRRLYDPNDDFHAYTDHIELLYDLGSIQTVNEFRIWPIVLSLQHNFPIASGVGFPTKIKLELLQAPDDTKPITLYNSDGKLPRPGANPLMQNLPRTRGQFFRLTLAEGIPEFKPKPIKKIALSEFELLCDGKVLTAGLAAKVKAGKTVRWSKIEPELLTDGLTNEGRIIPLRKWVELFRQRIELRNQRTELRHELSLILLQEHERIRYFAVGAIALIIILVLMIWVVRLLSARKWALMRDKIACDLHDEVGANLSSIAHSTELIKELIPNPTTIQTQLLDDAINTARLTSRETRQFIQLLEQRDTGMEVLEMIKKIADQMLINIPHTCTFTKSKIFNHLDPAQQWDLYFFLKESLNNIIKHAQASKVEIMTKKMGHAIQLVVKDDGCGIAPERLPLRALENRAKQLQGELDIEAPEGHGTQITLTLTKWRKG